MTDNTMAKGLGQTMKDNTMNKRTTGQTMAKDNTNNDQRTTGQIKTGNTMAKDNRTNNDRQYNG